MQKKQRFYQAFVKRPLDFLLSLTAFIIISPFLIIIAVLVKVKLGSPVLFRQERPGRNEKIFSLYKFRTMTDERDKDGELLPDAVRLTKFGKLLRKTSIDELPELVNIIRGDMSIIGPRPLLIRYLPYYTEEEKHRHDIRPGLTGLAQVSGRNFLNWEDRFALDLKYVYNITFIGDCIIILKTILKVIKREDVLEADVEEISFDDLDKERSKKV